MSDAISAVLPVPNNSLCFLCSNKFQRHADADTWGTWVQSAEETALIQNKIVSCTQVTLNLEQYTPFALCSICLTELNIAYNFRLKCLSTEIRLITTTTNVIPKICLPSYKAEILPNKCYDAIECDEDNESKCVNINIETRHQTKGTVSQYKCSVCCYSTPYKQTYLNHIRRHNGERPFQCTCGKSFIQRATLAAHKVTHSSLTEYTCSICGKQFKLAHALERHIRVHNEPAFTCNICFKKLKSKESLKCHLNRHDNIQNFSCEKCGNKFTTSSELISHKRKHEVNKNIQCHFCGYKTNSKKILIVHLKRHSGEKAHLCKLCNFSCYTGGELKVHHRVHTREKPYPCPICKQNFMHSSSVNKHVKTIHGKSFRWSTKQESKTKL